MKQRPALPWIISELFHFSYLVITAELEEKHLELNLGFFPHIIKFVTLTK